MGQGEQSAQGRLIRPYAITGGRTGRDSPPMALEALVRSTPLGLQTKHQFRWEAARVIDLARSEMAVVELAARLDVPIGVTRVVIADLSKKGAVTISVAAVSDTAEMDGDQYATLLKKVLDGIKSL